MKKQKGFTLLKTSRVNTNEQIDAKTIWLNTKEDRARRFELRVIIEPETKYVRGLFLYKYFAYWRY